jgi:hypothetical protein
MSPDQDQPDNLETSIDDVIRKDLVEVYGGSRLDDAADFYEDSILRATVEDGISRSCKTCGALVQRADFVLHRQWHNQIDGMITTISGLLNNVNLAHELIDFLEPRARRRYNQRNNMDTVAGTILPRGSDLGR